ncbi:MAG: tetratricopeptide repeat protein [Myxococcota bacterium]|nr:tetratricopeptide repeat protein [Myxococcota bacterium]
MSKIFPLLSSIIVCIFAFNARGDLQQTIVNLENKLAEVSGKEKVDLLNEIAYVSYIVNPEKSLHHGTAALSLSKELGYKKGEASALCNKSWSYIILGRYGDALPVAKESLKIRQHLGIRKDIAASLRNIGSIYQYLEDLQPALQYQLEALKIAEELGDKRSIASSYHAIGLVYTSMRRSHEALEYYNKSLTVAKEIGNTELIITAYSNIGLIYREALKEPEKALDYNRKALALQEETGMNAGAILMGIGRTLLDLGRYEEALQYLNRSLKKKRETGEKGKIVGSLSGIGQVYLKQKNYTKARKYLNEAVKLAKAIGNETNMKFSYKMLYQLHKATGNSVKALKYLEKYQHAYESVFNRDLEEKVANMQVRYDTLKKEKENALLVKRNEILQQEKKLLAKEKALLSKDNEIKAITRNSFVVGFVLALIILFLLFNRYRYLFDFWKSEKYVGQFRIIERIGSGGMGTIYKAHSLKDKSEIVAVKVLTDERSQSERSSKRFKYEAAIAHRIEHPNIVKMIERGEYRDKLFIVMELLKGETLAQIIGQGRQPDLSICVHVIRQVADALSLIHSKGIVHRDIKPSNIMLIEKGKDKYFAKLMDFGVAKTDFQTSLTQTGYVVGTYRYMSPEQFSNKSVTNASDIYSLGVVFYELIAGKEVFQADDLLAFQQKLLFETPTSVEHLIPNIPPALAELVMLMLAKEPNARPSAESVVDQLTQQRWAHIPRTTTKDRSAIEAIPKVEVTSLIEPKNLRPAG